ncbi:MAG: ferritin [Thermoanaerobaculaceae bacterium]|jgi:ferritin|nr:ferritin [Thermoanaerobaculaceae bacterium]
MLNEKIQKALNEQVREEMASFYLYLSMSAYLEAQNLRGMASWMAKQAQEELGHAMKFFRYIHERGGRVTLEAIPKPENEWASPQAVFEATLAHERHITACIYKLVELATAERDHGTASFLQWFVTEQVEEEGAAEGILARFHMGAGQPAALLFLDRELGARQ